MILFPLTLALAIISNFGLALLVLLRGSNKIANRVFFAFAFFVGLWILSNFIPIYDTNPSRLIFELRSTFSIVVPLLISLLIFSFYFPRQMNLNWIKLCIFYISPAIAIVALTYSDLLVSAVTKQGQILHVEYGSINYLIAFLFFTLLILSATFRNFYLQFKDSKGVARDQVRFVFAAIGISTIFATVMDLILPIATGNDFWANFGPLGTVAIVALVSYSIVAHRLFDIRVIIKRTVIFAGLSAFILGSYAAIVFIAATLFGARGSSSLAAEQMIPNLIAALLIAVGFEPLRKWLTERTDKWLFKGEYTPQEVLRELSETLANVVDIGEAVEEMIQVVTKAMRLTKSAAFLVQPADKEGNFELKRVISVGHRHLDNFILAPKDSLVEYFVKTHIADKVNEPVVLEELLRQIDDGVIAHERAQITGDFIKRIQNLGGAVALPLFIRRQQPVPTPPGTPPRFREVEMFIGVLVLGEKKSGDAFTDQDLKLLQIVASQTAAAVEKSRLFEEDQLKSEFVAVASHELLTPTAAMEGYLSMILDEGMGKVDDQARGYLNTVFSESKRLASLVKDLLNVSRIERGKITVNLAPLDLNAAINQVLLSLKFRAEERKIKLIYTETKMPQIKADPEKLTEVLINLLGNAIKYTPEGGQAVITTEQKNGQIFIHIKDNGIGMKPEDAQHLFTKFFRASNSDQTNQGGTGLGLYITKNIIELMGGVIAVESQLNKGSTFTFSVPIAK